MQTVTLKPVPVRPLPGVNLGGGIFAVARRPGRAELEMPLIYHEMAGLGGFRDTPELKSNSFRAVPSQPLSRAFGILPPDTSLEDLQMITRGMGDDFASMSIDQRFEHLNRYLQGLTRAGILSTNTGFPVRENLEAEAKILVPLETPFRNMLARVPGSGLASAWRQATSLGGGWGSSYDQPGGGSAAQIFYAEAGAPATINTVYAAKTAAYKLLGTLGSVTRFAMAAGANYMPQYSTETTHALMNVMLLEEFALINGDSTATAVPWGDGGTALAYDGIINLTTVANGVPSAQVQTSVGPLTTGHIDGQLNRIWKQGGRGQWMLMNIQEAQSLTVLLEAAGSLIRMNVSGAGAEAGHVVGGLYVTKYNNPATGEQVEIIRSRFMPAGTIIFGSKSLPDGSPAFDVDVLPQVEMPSNAAQSNIQGYAVSPISPSVTAPDLLPFLCSVYSCARMKSATVFAKSSGVTAVA